VFDRDRARPGADRLRVVSEREDDERPDAGEETGEAYALGRLVALSDGVFAIAMTLLVLNVPVPQLGGSVVEPAARKAFSDVVPNLSTFALSFVLVGVYWMVHHRIFRNARMIDQGVLWLNLITLLLVCLVPFSTSFFSRFGSTVTATEVYYGNLLLAGVAFTVLSTYGDRKGLLPIRQQRRAMVAARNLSPVAVFAAAMLMAPVWPEAARWAWVALLPVNILVGRVFRARSATRSAG
jgi:uncharacterized membrane protein